MNIAPNSTIAVPLKAVKREIKYASKLGARAAQGDLNVVRLLNVVQEGQVRETGGFFRSSRPRVAPRRIVLRLIDHSCAVHVRHAAHSCASRERFRLAQTSPSDRHDFFTRDPRHHPHPQNILILVWELVKGMDVLDFMNSHGGVMPERSAREYFKQLLDGIACIHAHGFCHRDIKPENAIIEQETGVLKIIDFGLSKHLDSARTLGIGTPDYMAPEILGRTPNPGGGFADGANETGSYDPESVDVWAMGVMLYLLLTGTYPFEDKQRPGNVTATLRRVREGRVNPFPKRVNPAARDLVGRMIQVDPRRRARLEDVANHPWLREETEGEVEMGDAASGSAGHDPAGPGGGAGTAAAPAGARETPRGGFARRVSGFFSGMFGGAGKREG